MNHPDRILEARKLMGRVVDIMAFAESDVRKILSKYLSIIASLSYGYVSLKKTFTFSANKKLEESVNKILDELEQSIYNTIIDRSYLAVGLLKDAYDYEEEKDTVSVFFLSMINGKILSDRISEYSSNLRKEFEAYLAIGISSGLSKDNITAQYLSNIKKPYKSALFESAILEKDYKAEAIRSKGLSFGVGKTLSAYTSLKVLEQDSIFKAYSNSLFRFWRSNPNIIGWYTQRGSSFSCPNYCDPMVGVFHPISESYSGYHTRCVCLAIPVYKSDL